jgi:lysophospholipase L1-like esterase
MKILAVGDSFTYGSDLEDRTLAWPIVLANKLNAEVTNLGKPGGGNTQAVRNIVERATEYDLVVVGWSSPGRVEFGTLTGTFDVWPGWQGRAVDMFQPEFAKLITASHEPKYLFRQYLTNIILVQNYLKSQNICYVMATTQGETEYYYKTFKDTNKDLLDKIDYTTFIEWPENGMAEWTFGCPKGKSSHFLEQGHKQVADKFYEHIRNLGRLP